MGSFAHASVGRSLHSASEGLYINGVPKMLVLHRDTDTLALEPTCKHASFNKETQTFTLISGQKASEISEVALMHASFGTHS